MAGISGLLAWGCYEIASVDPQRIITTVTVGLITFIMGGVTVAVNFHDKRIGINIKMLSGIFCVIGLMMDAIFSFFAYKISLFVRVPEQMHGRLVLHDGWSAKESNLLKTGGNIFTLEKGVK